MPTPESWYKFAREILERERRQDETDAHAPVLRYPTNGEVRRLDWEDSEKWEELIGS